MKTLSLLLLIFVYLQSVKAQVHGNVEGEVIKTEFIISSPRITSKKTVVYETEKGTRKSIYQNISLSLRDSNRNEFELSFSDDNFYRLHKRLPNENASQLIKGGTYNINTVQDSLNEQLQTKSASRFEINDIDCDLFISSLHSFDDFWADRMKANYFIMHSDSTGMLSLYGVSGKELILKNCKFKQLQLLKLAFNDTVSFEGSKFLGSIIYNNSRLPKYLNLQNIDLSQSSDKLDLTRFIAAKHRCGINLIGADLSKIKMDYQRFYLSFPKNTSREEKLNIYQSLLGKFKSDGFEESYRALDIEFQEFNYLQIKDNKLGNWLDKHWWLYGYDKLLIIKHGLYATLIFFILNFALLHTLVHKVYNIKSFSESYAALELSRRTKPLQFYFQKTIYTLLYTGYLFWGFRLDIEKINVKHYILSVYVILQYLLGIIFLAYIANIIIANHI